MTKVKICGLFRECDIYYVNEVIPDYAGFIIDFPKSHRSVDLQTAKKLISMLDKNIKSVCVFVNKPIEYILNFADFTDVIQLHGEETDEFISEIRETMPEKEIWKADKIRTLVDLELAEGSAADRVLLDNGYGTGETFDWNIISDFKREFILAGGLHEGNVREAIEQFAPYALDISSGVESEKLKDPKKIRECVNIIRNEV